MLSCYLPRSCLKHYNFNRTSLAESLNVDRSSTYHAEQTISNLLETKDDKLSAVIPGLLQQMPQLKHLFDK